MLRPAPWMLAALLGLGLLPTAPAAGELEDRVADVSSTVAAWDYNLSVFERRLEDIFPDLLPTQRQELAGRIRWARRMTAAELEALDGIVRALDGLRVAGTRGIDPRSAALARVDEAFRVYESLFAPELVRALDGFPRPFHRRARERPPPSPRPARVVAVEQALLGHVSRFVHRTSWVLQVRRDAFYQALQALQLARSPLDPRAWARLDAAFYDLQAPYAARPEPARGRVEVRAFPVEAPLAAQPALVPTSYAARFEEAPPPPGGRPRSPEEERALSRRAGRLKELDDLSRDHPPARLARDPEALRRAWAAYQEYRERWDGATGTAASP